MKEERLQEAFLAFAEALFGEVSENKMVFLVQDMVVKCSSRDREPPESADDFKVEEVIQHSSSNKDDEEN